MPCQACNNVFFVTPCVSKTGIITPKGIKNIKERGFFVSSEKRNGKEKVMKYVSNFYMDMHNACPCIQCLVKMICDYSISGCPDYKEFLSMLDKTKEKENDAN